MSEASTKLPVKIILSNRQCVLLLHAWWIYVKHSKRAEHAETGKFRRKKKSNNQRPRNLKFYLVRNYRNWSSLRCITLNARVCSLTLVFTSTGNGKTLPISLTYPKDQLKTSSEEWSMSLHTTSDNFVILKHKRLKGNCEKSDTGHIHLPYGHT